MKRATDNKIILIKRKTRLEELTAKYNTVAQAKFYIERLGSSFSDYEQEDALYKKALSLAEEILSGLGRLHILDREFLPNFVFGKNDLVVAVGQDGLVANILKYLNGQLLIGVNPDKTRYDGVLLPFLPSDLGLIVPDIFQGYRRFKEVTMAEASLNDGQRLYAVNDLFVGQKTHVSARYEIKIDNDVERQSSSGVIISTGLGSTGWLKSIIRGANGVVNALDMRDSVNIEQPSWNSQYLYYTVREPFPSPATKANIVFGKITKSTTLKIVSRMPENGVIFSDGMESDFLAFNSGLEAEIKIADKVGLLVV